MIYVELKSNNFTFTFSVYQLKYLLLLTNVLSNLQAVKLCAYLQVKDLWHSKDWYSEVYQAATIGLFD